MSRLDQFPAEHSSPRCTAYVLGFRLSAHSRQVAEEVNLFKERGVNSDSGQTQSVGSDTPRTKCCLLYEWVYTCEPHQEIQEEITG